MLAAVNGKDRPGDPTRTFRCEKDDRIRSHVFLCVLAYYVQWHMEPRLSG